MAADLEDADAATLVRLIRTHRRLSQRELAAMAGVPHSTVDRIESGTSEPRFSTLRLLLAVTGHRLMVLDHRGRPIAPDPQLQLLHDRGGRQFPAHLPYGKVRDPASPLHWGWWGWFRIAWSAEHDWVPESSYWRPRPRRFRLVPLEQREVGLPYDDAT